MAPWLLLLGLLDAGQESRLADDVCDTPRLRACRLLKHLVPPLLRWPDAGRGLDKIGRVD